MRFTNRTGPWTQNVHTADASRKMTVPVHSDDLKRGTLRGIIAQAGFRMPEFLALL